MNTPLKVALIGAGNIGRRHLQALMLIDRDVVLHIVDPDERAISAARDCVLSIQNTHVQNVVYQNRLENIGDVADVVIVATNSNVRRHIIEQLFERGGADNLLLEKFLFPKIDDYAIVDQLIERQKVGACVNCPRRMWPGYQRIRERLRNASAVGMNIGGSNIGIGCNAIHFLDLYAYLSGGDELSLIDLLEDGSVESKREKYIEFVGAIGGVSQRRATFSLTSYVKPSIPLCVQIQSDEARYVVDEAGGQVWEARADNGWKWSCDHFESLYQSKLTHLAVKQIVDTKTSTLTTYKESAALHVKLLKLLMSHMRLDPNNPEVLCPIT